MGAVTVENYTENIAYGKYHIAFLGASGVGSGDTTIGNWVRTDGFEDGSIHVTGIAGGTVVQVYVTNTDAPADATDYDQLGSDITADGTVAIEFTYKYTKVKVSTAGTGTAKADGIFTRKA
jgi:hypothetical protein